VVCCVGLFGSPVLLSPMKKPLVLREAFDLLGYDLESGSVIESIEREDTRPIGRADAVLEVTTAAEG
jgi:hypothetical protein